MRGERTAIGEAHDGRSYTALIVHEWRDAWRPGLAALIGGSISYSLYAAVSSLFVEPLQSQFGWSRGQIALVHGFGLITAFAAPVVGRLTDRHGVRPVLSGGLVLTALDYALLALMSGSLGYYYAVYSSSRWSARRPPASPSPAS